MARHGGRNQRCAHPLDHFRIIPLVSTGQLRPSLGDRALSSTSPLTLAWAACSIVPDLPTIAHIAQIAYIAFVAVLPACFQLPGGAPLQSYHTRDPPANVIHTRARTSNMHTHTQISRTHTHTHITDTRIKHTYHRHTYQIHISPHT